MYCIVVELLLGKLFFNISHNVTFTSIVYVIGAVKDNFMSKFEANSIMRHVKFSSVRALRMECKMQ